MYVETAKTPTPPPSYSETLGPANGQPTIVASASVQPTPGGFVGNPVPIPQPQVYSSSPQHVHHYHHHTSPPPPLPHSPIVDNGRYLSPPPSGYGPAPHQGQPLLIPYPFPDPRIELSLEAADARARRRFWGGFFWAFFIWWIVWVIIGIEADILFGGSHRHRHGGGPYPDGTSRWDFGQWWSSQQHYQFETK
ncbi:hypothetical protein BDN72DRAFT_876783 [Pluteus cervinus]|uniref:Uncharacterized protein n=1 Tax=Pluteus cervinus TaxID=181527 RepID=A0ACD3B378_9AGAR|nr:hypothetical protein BDN72DRAFT_876783 [Pluteus cervinus]